MLEPTTPMSKMKTNRSDFAWLIILLLILAYTLIYSWIAYTKFASFHSFRPQDMAAHNQAIWNTAHGRFLQQTILYIGGLNHFYPILAIFAPIYQVTNHIYPLLFLYSLILASGALPVYLLAKDLLGSRDWGLLMGLSYLIYPGLHLMNFLDLKPIVLSAPLILYSFYFWQARKLQGFSICLLLASLTTEQVAPLIIMFAPLSWIRRRDRSWILIPLLVGAATLLISIYIYVPWASGAPYKHLRSHKFFSHIDPFSWKSYRYVFSFAGLGIIFLFLSWEAFVPAIPYLFFGMFATRIDSYYYCPLSATLFTTLIYGLKKIKEWKPFKGTPSSPKRMILLTGLALLIFFAFDPFLIRPQYSYPKHPSDCDAWSLIRRIPQGASVTAEPCLLPALSLRGRLHEFSRREYHGQKINYLDVDYILIDPTGPHRINRHRRIDYTTHAQNFMAKTLQNQSGFEIIAAEGDWVLFHRKKAP